jgi:predicted RNA-binding Zn-ribbon protein involved in translation (DUF1610 family)
MIKPNQWNVNILTDEEFRRLKRLMEESGQERTPPVVVREKDGYYEIVDGEQRWRAAGELGWRELPIMVIKASDPEAKKYTLSVNYLKGRINYVKMIQLMAGDEEVAAAVKEVFSKPEAAALEKLANLYREGKIAQKALKILEEGVRKGARIDPRMLGGLEVIPEVHQDTAMRLILMAHDPDAVKEVMLRQHEPEALESPSGTREKAAVAEEAGGAVATLSGEEPLEEAAEKGAAGVEERKAVKEEAEEPARGAEGEESIEKSVRSVVAPAEAIVSFECDKCQARHTVYYNRERKTIEVCMIRDVWGNSRPIRTLSSDTYEIHSVKLACPGCGRVLGVDFEERKVVDLGEDRED